MFCVLKWYQQKSINRPEFVLLAGSTPWWTISTDPVLFNGDPPAPPTQKKRGNLGVDSTHRIPFAVSYQRRRPKKTATFDGSNLLKIRIQIQYNLCFTITPLGGHLYLKSLTFLKSIWILCWQYITCARRLLGHLPVNLTERGHDHWSITLIGSTCYRHLPHPLYNTIVHVHSQLSRNLCPTKLRNHKGWPSFNDGGTDWLNDGKRRLYHHQIWLIKVVHSSIIIHTEWWTHNSLFTHNWRENLIVSVQRPTRLGRITSKPTKFSGHWTTSEDAYVAYWRWRRDRLLDRRTTTLHADVLHTSITDNNFFQSIGGLGVG